MDVIRSIDLMLALEIDSVPQGTILMPALVERVILKVDDIYTSWMNYYYANL